MAYQVIQPPFTLDFPEMSKQELADYGKWFHANIPDRLSQLESAVRGTAGYESWTATYEPDSLNSLGAWFTTQVEIRARSESEMSELRARSPMLAQAPSAELTNRTFSLAMDVGMYLGRVLERAHAQLVWKQILGSKKDANYGQPVLAGFGKIVLNPVHVAVTFAYGVASGKRSGERLREIFNYWSGQASSMKT